MQQRKGRLLTAVVATAATIVAVNRGAASEPPTIGLAMADLRTDLFVQVEQSAEKAAKDRGVAVVVLDAKDDAAIQAAQVQDLADRKVVQAIIYLPAGAQASALPVKTARAAGIPVVTVDRNPLEAPGDTFVGTDQTAAAAALGRYACLMIGGAGDLAEIIGQSHTGHEDDRNRGFSEALAKCPGVTEADRDYSTRWSANEARFEAGRMLARDPEIALIFAHADTLALGAALAVREAYVGHKVYVLGFDGDAEGLQAVDSGLLDATMTQPARRIGRLAMQSALDLVAGKPVPAEQLQDAVLTTKSNVDHLIADRP